MTCEAYWEYSRIALLNYRRDEEYAEHFASLFEEAVRCRLRSHGPVASHLSGGLDSSTVVSVAHRVCLEAGQEPPRTFSLVFPRHHEADETALIAETAGLLCVPSNLLEPEGTGAAYYEAQARRYSDLPGFPNGSMGDVIRRTATQQGVRVMLTGCGGDELFYGTGHLLSELVQRRRFSALS